MDRDRLVAQPHPAAVLRLDAEFHRDRRVACGRRLLVLAKHPRCVIRMQQVAPAGRIAEPFLHRIPQHVLELWGDVGEPTGTVAVAGLLHIGDRRRSFDEGPIPSLRLPKT